jgi:2-iminobutanoate/2-iminopropanoate deaminase
MHRHIVSTEHAPQAVGPYSQAVVCQGTLLYTAGQIGFDPKTGELVSSGVEEQTRQALQNIQAVLKAAGTNLGTVVKTTVYLKDMADFTAMNAVYATFFSAAPPARSTVEVARLPRDARVEIEAVALLPEA